MWRMMLGILLLVACSSDGDSVPALGAPDIASGSNVDGASSMDLDALRALGYLDYADVSNDDQNGLSFIDISRSSPGLTLMASRPNRMADLVNHEGEIVHTWSSTDTEGRWVRARLLEGGDLLVVGKGADGPGEARYLQRIHPSGEELWRRPMAIHHEVAAGPSGGWLTLELVYRQIEEIHASVPIRDDRILFLNAEGQRVRSFSLFDSLLASGVQISPVDPYEGDSGLMLDIFHSNSLFWMDTVIPRIEGVASHPIYQPQGVLICIRHQNMVAIIDSVRGDVRWVWGTDELSGPHDATLLDSGNVLIFDNGLGRNQSRVVEVDPRTSQIVWEYEAPNPTDFYSASRGSAQRLPNGNTLIAESDEGHAFEVTPDGDVVWDYYSHRRSARDGGRATIIRAIRYPDTWIP